MTLDAAAAGVGTVRSTWYDWETGRRLPGDRETYEKIYRFAGLTPNDLIFPFGLPTTGQLELPIDAGAGPLFDAARPEHELQAAA